MNPALLRSPGFILAATTMVLAAIALGVVAGLLHLPIREVPVARLAPAGRLA